MNNKKRSKHSSKNLNTRREKAQAIALDLLEKGVDIATISEKTGLSAEEVEALRVIRRREG